MCYVGHLVKMDINRIIFMLRHFWILQHEGINVRFYSSQPSKHYHSLNGTYMSKTYHIKPPSQTLLPSMAINQRVKQSNIWATSLQGNTAMTHLSQKLKTTNMYKLNSH